MRSLALLPFLLLSASCALLYDFGGDGGGAGTTASTDATGSGIGASTGSGQGASCDRDAVCATGHCVDGVCCDTTCDGPCQRCSASGACEPLPQDTECAPGSCEGGTVRLPSTCSPGGACIQGAAVNCLMGCAGLVCAGCTPDDCGATQFCPPEGGACVDRLPQGASCMLGDACLSGFCTDGVCCQESCLDPCESCDAAGACVPAMTGSDLEDECPMDPGCGRTGECSGLGSCALQDAALICVSQTCTNGTVFPIRHCDGNGSCAPPTSMPCPGNLACNGDQNACLPACTVPADCTNGTSCVNGACTNLKPNGAGCSMAAECGSAHCVDSVCCDDFCIGACRGCTNALTGLVDGTCANVTDGQADSLCVASPPDLCGGTGQCFAGQCGNWPAGTDCRDTCNGNRVQRNECDGQGSCVSMNEIVCAIGDEFCCDPMTVADAHCEFSGSTCN